MTIFFSPSTAFFYDDQVNSFIPDDAYEFSAEERAALLARESHGRRVGVDEGGAPVLIDPPPPDSEVLAAIERHWRDEHLLATDGVVSRHRDEVEEGSATTLSAAQYMELQAYRRALRDWPAAGEFPLSDHRPSPPLWLSGQLQ